MSKIILLLALIANNTHLLQSMHQNTNPNYNCLCEKNTTPTNFLARYDFSYLGQYAGVGIMLKPALHCLVRSIDQWTMSEADCIVRPNRGQSYTKSALKSTAYLTAAATCLIAGGYYGAQLGTEVNQHLAQH